MSNLDFYLDLAPNWLILFWINQQQMFDLQKGMQTDDYRSVPRS